MHVPQPLLFLRCSVVTNQMLETDRARCEPTINATLPREFEACIAYDGHPPGRDSTHLFCQTVKIHADKYKPGERGSTNSTEGSWTWAV